MIQKTKLTIISAGLINLVAFAILFFLIYPIYNSKEDTYVLYLLGGGFGNEPTEMLHYNYGLNPFLGWFVKDLFQFNNRVNWYTISLIFAHYISCTIILATIIQKKNTLIAYLSFAALFIVFEGYFLLFPDFTNASLILAITALLFLLIKSWGGFLRYRHCLFAGALLLLASFYRIHVIIPLAGIALPFFIFTLVPRARRRALVTLLLSGLFILLLNKVHETYYKAIKEDWAQEEGYRQKVFRFFNDQGSLKNPAPGEQWYAEHELITHGMFIDTSLIPAARLDSMYHDLKKAGNVNGKLPAAWWKWFFINNRLFFCITLVFLVLYGWKRKLLPAVITSLVLMTGGFIYLLIKAKLPPYILVSSLSFICFAVFLYGDTIFTTNKKIPAFLLPAFLSLLTLWGVLRLYRTSGQNSTATWQFKQEYAEMAAYPGNLFIGLNSFHNNKFYAFDVPAAYSLPNYLHSEMFLGGIYGNAFERFGINDFPSLFSSSKVLFWGDLSDVQKEYFEKMARRPLKFVLVPGFKQAKVWRVESQN